MKNPPRTREEAKKIRYRRTNTGMTIFSVIRDWYNGKRCAWDTGSGQCLEFPGHGPAKLYCKQHAAIVAADESEGEG